MSLANMVRTIKQIHPEDVVLIKIGVFYHAYGKDAYIISYLFGYKRNAFGENSSTCGFPKSALNYVKTVLEEKKINYITIDRAHQYEVEEKQNFKKENRYLEIYQKAQKNIGIQDRAMKIYHYMIENIEEETIKLKIKEVEEVLYNEKREVCSN